MEGLGALAAGGKNIVCRISYGEKKRKKGESADHLTHRERDKKPHLREKGRDSVRWTPAC